MTTQTPNKNDLLYRRLIWVFSVVIFLTILILSRLPKAETVPSWLWILPAMNAILNGSTFVILLFSLFYIRKKKVQVHKRLNLTAVVLSTFFLLSYVTFHSFGVETKFPAENPLRPIYLFILITHIVLAAVVLPLVLLSLYRGLTMQVDKHRKLVRWSYPVWLYVTLSGVVVYLMISPYYKF